VATVVTIVVLHTLLAVGCKVGQGRSVGPVQLERVHMLSSVPDVLLPDGRPRTSIHPDSRPTSHRRGNRTPLTNRKEAESLMCSCSGPAADVIVCLLMLCWTEAAPVHCNTWTCVQGRLMFTMIHWCKESVNVLNQMQTLNVLRPQLCCSFHAASVGLHGFRNGFQWEQLAGNLLQK